MLFDGYLWQKCLFFLSWNAHLKKTFIIKVNKSRFQRNRVKLSPPQLYIKLCPIGCWGGGVSPVRRVFLMRGRKSKNDKTKSTKKTWQEKWKWSESGGQNMKLRDVFSGLSLNSAFELNMKVWGNLFVFIMKWNYLNTSLHRYCLRNLNDQSLWAVVEFMRAIVAFRDL